VEILEEWGPKYWWIKYKLAESPYSGEEVFRRLLDLNNSTITKKVLANSVCPENILLEEFGEGSTRYISSILMNKRCPAKILVWVHSQFGRGGLGEVALGHPNFPNDISGWAIEVEEW
jgi:hypothetical protein